MSQTKTIYVHLLRYKKSDLLMARSDDLPGLVVHGRSEDEIEEKLPGAIREILEASGIEVFSVTAAKDPGSDVENFGPPAFIASAAIAATA